MKSVLISIQPKWCESIARGWKTIEIRKSVPKLETPFKVYIYCTKNPKLQFWTGPRYSYADDHSHNAFDRCGNGCVIGEFVCDEIQNFIWVSDDLPFGDGGEYYLHDEELKAACMSYQQFEDYGQKQDLYGWHISELKIYPTPKAITEFRSYNCGVRWEDGLPIPDHEIKRAPQSWCYVEDS